MHYVSLMMKEQIIHSEQKKIHANNRQIEDKIVKVRLKFQTPIEVHNVFQIINKVMCLPTQHH